MMDLNTQEIVEMTKILHWKIHGQEINEAFHKRHGGIGDDKIINIHQNVNKVRSISINE